MNKDYPAIAVDWLDAYRASDLDGILALYTEDATLACGCGGSKTVSGKEALRAYWEDRLAKVPASGLKGVARSADGATVEYRTPKGVVRIDLHFDGDGRIARAECAPAGQRATQSGLSERDEIARHRQLMRQCLALAAEVKDPAAAERLKRLAENHAREMERLSRKRTRVSTGPGTALSGNGRREGSQD